MINRQNEKEVFTINKTIMDYAADYAKRDNAMNGEREAIIHVRSCKNAILPFEVIEYREGKQTKEFRNVLDKSSVTQKISFDEVPKPHKRLLETWTQFLHQLKMQQVDTRIDFIQNASTKYQVSNNLNYIKITNNHEEMLDEKERERCREQICMQREVTNDVSWRHSVA